MKATFDIESIRETIADNLKTEIDTIPIEDMRLITSHLLKKKKGFFWATVIFAAYEATEQKSFDRIHEVVLGAEMYNLGTVLLDDIVEDHATRLNEPSAYYAYGAPKTILTALYLMNRAHVILQDVFGSKNSIPADIQEACVGWYEKDLMTNKSLQHHHETLERIIAFPLAFIRTIVKGSPQELAITTCFHNLLLAQIILDECKDMIGVFGRPKAEEFLHGIDTVLTLKAKELRIGFELNEHVWQTLQPTEAYAYVKSVVEKHLAQSKEHMDMIPYAPLLTSIFATVTESAKLFK